MLCIDEGHLLTNPMNAKPPYKVLFLCTGNSARSILAEFILRHRGHGRFESYSAGSTPTGSVNPFALAMLKDYGIDTQGARSKSWHEYRDVRFDFVITVCDHARESCPVWPGQPIVAHWGSPDPAAVQGDEATKQRAFKDVATQIYARLNVFCAFRDEQLTEWAVRDLGQQFQTSNSR